MPRGFGNVANFIVRRSSCPFRETEGHDIASKQGDDIPLNGYH